MNPPKEPPQGTSANAVDVATDGLPVTGQLLFLGAVLALAVSLAPLATSVALRITASR